MAGEPKTMNKKRITIDFEGNEEGWFNDFHGGLKCWLENYCADEPPDTDITINVTRDDSPEPLPHEMTLQSRCHNVQDQTREPKAPNATQSL